MRKLAGLMLLCLVVVACSNANQSYNLLGQSTTSVKPPEKAPPASSALLSPDAGAPEPAAQERIVLTNVTIDGVVENPATTIIQFSNMTAELGGWIISSNVNQNAGRNSGMIAMRIPAQRIQDALSRVRATMLSVTSENNAGQDVTQDFVDTNSQIVNLEAAEANLKKIMDAATNTDDVLKVFNQLNAIRNQIQVAKGKVKYWSEASAFASITVNLSAKTNPAAFAGAPTTPDWTPARTFQDALGTMTRLTQGLVDVLIWLAVVVVPFAIPAAIVWLIWRRISGKTRLRA